LEISGSVDVFLSYLGRGPGRFYVQRADTSLQGRSSAIAAFFPKENLNFVYFKFFGSI
jgi:hypothetical protein